MEQKWEAPRTSCAASPMQDAGCAARNRVDSPSAAAAPMASVERSPAHDGVGLRDEPDEEAAVVGVEVGVAIFIASGSRRARDRRLPAQHAERSA